jgi:hypothetical protein
MGFRTHRLGLIVASVLSLWAASLHAQVSVTTYHNDNARTGQNTQETYLTPANVNSSQFGKLFTVVVDGAVFAQPLYLTNVNISGGTHNVVYVATQHDSVYAIDADTGTLYWQKSLIPSGGSTVSSNTDLNFCGDIAAEVGITSTPVIDATTGTLYVVAKVKLNGAILQYLHALDVSTAAEKFGGPVSIQASVPGTATDGNGSMVAFDSRQENQRAGLLLENGHVVISWAAHCDKTPYHGWVMSYGATTLTQEGVYNTSPNGSANGIWMSGAGPAADSSGNIYFATGNGTWSTTDNGDSIVKLGPPSGSTLPLLDYFTPYDQGSLAAADLDVSAGGVVLLPTASNGKQLLAMLSKAGTIYLIDTASMGKYCVTQTPACTNSDTNIVQEIPKAFTGYWGAPAFWNGYLYWSGGNDTSGAAEPLKAYSFDANGSGLISTSPTSVAAHSFNFSGPVPSVSSNGSSNGIVWGMDNSSFASTCSGGTGCQVLYAYDATNLANMLYNSNQAPNNRDVPGSAVKFTTPTIANGKVYVAGKGSVSAFGLLSAVAPTATAPTLSPIGGTYTSAQTVSIADTTPGAVIYYTTDGSTPTTASATYAAAITVSATTTVKAIAVASGYTTSPVSSATYTISTPTAATPTFSPAAGTYTAAQSITLADTTSGATIYYTTDGTTPTTVSAKYSAAITVSATTTIKAIAVASGYTNSAVGSASYTISVPAAAKPSFSPAAGTYTAAQSVTLADTTAGASIYYTTDGSTPTTASAIYSAAIPVSATTTIKAIAVAAGFANSAVGSATYTISAPTAAAPTFSPAAGAYTTTQTVTLGDATAGAAIYYTTDGTTPTTASAQYSTALTIAATTTVKAIAVASGYNNSAVSSAGYTISAAPPPTAAAPTVSPAAGTYTSAQAVTLADSTSGAVIYYTIDGSTPTTASAVYSGALSVNATTVIKAIAVASGYANSAVTSATYTISASGAPVSTPVSLASAANVHAIGTNGAAVTNGGIDTWGYAYSSSLLGSTVTWSGVTFNLGAPGTAGAASNTTLALPAVSSTALNLLAVAVNGHHRNSFVVTYTDGTTATFTQSLSDWVSSLGYAGESVAVSMTYRINQYGVIDNRPVYIYGYTFALDSTKTVKSVTLPATRNIVVVAATLSTASGSTPPTAATPTSSPGAGTYTTTQSVTLADTTAGAVIYYTTDGSTPTTASAVYSTPLTVGATTTVKAIAVANGYTTSAVGSATYTISATPPPAAATPTLSPAGGAYASAQTVTLADTTAGAVIYYTTDGSVPTTASTTYSAAITVGATATIKAIAAASGYSLSAVGSATYTISAPPAAAAPTLSLPAATYSQAQTVTLADSTAGAVIYYTTDGSTPTTSSAVYSTALTVSATTTVNAFAAASGYSNSAVTSATYTIATSGSTGTSPVSLAAASNVYAIGTNGVRVTNGGLDTWGFAYSSNLLGSTVTWSGVTFNLGTAGTADAVSNTTITLPAVNSAKLYLLATAVNGNHPNQTFVLTYTDGTTTTLTQSVSDWYAPQNYTGESIAVTMAYRINQYGVIDNHVADLYGYSFAIDATKTVKSLTLPASRNIVVLAVTL